MRVAIVAESFLPSVNGVTNSVLRILEALEREGHSAMVVAPDAPSDQPRAPRSHGDVPVRRCRSVHVPKISSLPIAPPPVGLTAEIRAFAPDVVHVASPFVLGAAGVITARRIGVPAVAVYQTDVAGFAESYGLGLAHRAAWRWTRYIHSRAERTLAPSTSAMEDLREHGIPRVHRWGRGVDIQRFAPGARSSELRAGWGGPDDIVVGYVGRLAPEKHLERLRALGADPRFRLVIVGDGPERGRLERLLPTATFTGQLSGDDLARAYASFDVFVHPGEHETFCQSVQEALASGVPAIAPDAGGPRDLIAHCRNGFLLPVSRFEELLPSAVIGLAESTTRERFAAAARKSVLRRTWPALCDQLFNHYDEARGLRGSRDAVA
ncbi:glycosyltransferase family 4 protein [Millisia brevis]|uniref:glycosyltransferase family 4 protein n=1 Tax=Millisia brevis TaxID=264148 RepID=UPI00082B44B5|nr:glycosyltransferase family 1 protein [Millisia brevis]